MYKLSKKDNNRDIHDVIECQFGHTNQSIDQKVDAVKKQIIIEVFV